METLLCRLWLAVRVWREDCRRRGLDLTRAECEVLVLAAQGMNLEQIAVARGTALSTARKHSQTARDKTMDDSLGQAGIRLLRDASTAEMVLHAQHVRDVHSLHGESTTPPTHRMDVA